ncbi:MAG: tRNA-dihydrouridine synthase [Candidatus Woesebacteria bacterium]|jgi:tRNA-dihydrouridine synthase
MTNFWHNLPKPFFALAPMDGVTDVVFRHVVAKAGKPDLFFTEFVNTDSFCSAKGKQATASRLAFTPDEQPIIAQIWGANPEHYSIAARELKGMGFAGIDINMGCPVKDVIKKGSGSALITTPNLAAEIIAATKEAGLPVSVKTRIGFKQRNTEEWLGFLLQQNLDALTVHGRTQKEQSKAPADWSEISKAVQLRNQISPRTLIIGNGDVKNRADGLDKAQQYGVDGIMIGRGVFANVFCFKKEPKQHSHKEYLDLLIMHLDLFEKQWPENPFAPLKRFFKIYIRDFSGASEIRDRLMHTTSTNEAREIIKSLLQA